MVDTAPASDDRPLILVADDDEMQRFLMGEALEAEGFAVHCVINGAEALACLDSLKPDVILLDVVMPVMDGYAACSAIRGGPSGEQVPIVMVTGKEDINSVAKAYEAGATDFIGKPLNWTIFRHRIRYVYRAGKTLKQLALSETRLAEAQRIAQLGSWEWLTGEPSLHVSVEAGRIFDLSLDNGQLELGELCRRIHPEDRGSFETELLHLKEGAVTLSSEVRLALGDQAQRVVEIHAAASHSERLDHRVVRGTFQDVTERRQTEAKLYHLAHHDSVTGLPNRPLLHDRLDQALARARREGIDAAVICIDIDHFKDINDTYGHAFGDVLLQQVATRLQNQVRGVDTVARLGGDAFAIAQVGLSQPLGAERLTNRLLDALREPFKINGEELFIGVSIGVAIGPHDADDPEQLLINADIALHGAKTENRGLCHFFEGGMDVAFRARKQIELDIRAALDEGWFELHYQPQIAVDRETIIGVEALIRLRHPERGLIRPDHFIPIAEETGLIAPVGDWVVQEACEQAARWQVAGLPALRVAVNLSPVQFSNNNLADGIIRTLAKNNLDPHLFEVEITESVLIHETRNVTQVLEHLQKNGVQIAMDDFGTGYSSLGYLLRFPFNRIKIDRSFVKDMTENPDAAAIVGAVVALARRLNMSTIAEGVETLDQFNRLRDEGCDEVQGYYFSRPLPAEDITAMMIDGKASSLKQPA